MEMILSKDVREYLKQNTHAFTDSEIATLIHNSEWNMSEKHKALSQLASKTENKVLKQQIEERLQYEQACIRSIRENTGEFVYKLEVWEEEDEKHFDAGYFPKYELARYYANNCNKEFICCSTYGKPRSKNYHWTHYKKLLSDNNMPNI